MKPVKLHVVAISDSADIEATIKAHLDWPTEGRKTKMPKSTWKVGTTELLPYYLPQGFIVDLSKLDPAVQKLVFFIEE